MDNSIKSFSIINSAVMKKSYTEAMTHVSQIVTYVHSKRERNAIQRRKKGRTMMQALELLQLMKRHVS